MFEKKNSCIENNDFLIRKIRDRPTKKMLIQSPEKNIFHSNIQEYTMASSELIEAQMIG